MRVPSLARPPVLPSLENPPLSVAVVRMSAIGDVVHAMPVVASLREAWPHATLDWVIQPGPRRLVAPHPDVDEFLLFRRDRILRGPWEFRRRVDGRRWDLVLVLQPYLKAGVAAALMRADVKLGWDRGRSRDLHGLFVTHRIAPRGHAHVQDRNFEFLEHLGVPVVRRWDFAFGPAERAAQREFFERLDRPALAVALRTTRPDKDWIPERYARVLEIARREHGLRPVLVGSGDPAERAVAERVTRLSRVRPVNALGNDLRRLAWLLDGAALALSPDSAPLHIASALGTPVIGLYGCTDPRRAGPYRLEFRDLVVNRYPRAGESRDRPPVREYRAGRMERITVDDVAEKLALAAARYL